MFGLTTVKKTSVLNNKLSYELEVQKELKNTIEEMRVEMQGLRKKNLIYHERNSMLAKESEDLKEKVRDLSIKNYDLVEKCEQLEETTKSFIVENKELESKNSLLEAQAKYQVKTIAALYAKNRKVRDEKGRFAPKEKK